jgi:RNA polymerase sigma-70 factor (ECF subfamily)
MTDYWKEPIMDEEEARWVGEARGGNKDAFSRLVEAYQRPVYNLAFRLLGNAQEAEDATQETFVRAYSRLRQYDSSHTFATWLFSIANHHCIDRLRKRRVRFVSVEANPLLHKLLDEGARPEQRVLEQLQAAEVQTLLDGLAPEHRTPLVLRNWEEYSLEQIAETLGLTAPAVKNRLFRARKQLAGLYQAVERKPAPSAAGERNRREQAARGAPVRASGSRA